ncbi:Cilia- and flagella-associated protein 74 [Phytophthora ramorum]|uniref:Cilia- and flagella-associated protein 74 n=1 Tax=Phytophthora ramorum TaxID=164328 RepID=UPI0030B4C451|nr:Cilia- and flagella-associated protein 74 [Phytophthora ramorum]
MASRDEENPRAPVQQRVHDGFQADRRYLCKMVEGAQDERATRIEAVLELKRDLDAASARIGAQSSALRDQTQAAKAQEARTHQSLLDQGKNPYEVARRKVVEREATKTRARIDRGIHEREAKLLERLQAEKVLQRRREKAEAEHRAYERKYQREMGRAAQDERTSAYLLSRTGKEALDPTGKLVRVYPSQETTMKDHSFGLGRSAVRSADHRRRVVAKVLAKPAHAGAQPASMLLPRRRGLHPQQESEPDVSSSRSEEAEQQATELRDCEKLVMPPLPGGRPGQELRTVNHALLSSESDVKLPPIAARNAHRPKDPRQEEEENQAAEDTPNAGGSSSKRKKPRGRSVLEERQLAKARQRQKDARFDQPQVVWGKTFTGNAFLANPQLLWFKDFDVGRPLTLGFTLTNVSNTFNQFRLLPMDDQVMEQFDVVYDKPGRMSAGMSCALRMAFTGTEGRDLDTTLSVAAPTGVFQIPVRCTCKKAVPVVAQRDVQFPEVVAGERTTVALTLGNEGALPLEYRVRRLRSVAVQAPPPAALVDLPAAIEIAQEVPVVGDSNDNSVDDDATEGVSSDENPQEDGGEAVEEAADVDDQVDRASVSHSSRATSAASPKTSATSESPGDNAGEDEDDARDPLSLEEQELVERVCGTMRFKPEGADEPVRFTRRGTVPPYSSSSVSFTFAPAAAMELDNEQFVLEFPASSGISSPDLRRLATIPVRVSGVAAEVPIFVARSRLNFRCCAYGKLYRHGLVVCNRGKVALKVQVRVPKALAGYVEFHPGFGFVQAAGASQEGQFAVQVKFRPDERMWKRIERAGFGSRELGMLAVPVPVVVPDQVVPVFFLLTARLTPTTLTISMETRSESSDGGLHFGACCVGHSVSRELTITNSARVPQRLGVTKLPKDVTVADSSAGVGIVLLPGEARSLRLVYEPSFPGALKAAGPAGRGTPILTLWSSTFHQEHTLPCSGSGAASDLSFSHTAVRLGATSLGQAQTCNLKLTNQSDRHSYLVELRLPPEAVPFVRITPLVVRLAPQEAVRLEIDFEPTEDIFKLVEGCYFEGTSPGNAPSGDEESASEAARSEVSLEQTGEPLSNENSVYSEAKPAPRLDAEPRSCHHTWTVLCFHHREDETGSSRSKTEGPAPLQALEVRTTVVEPFLTPSANTLDFGQVAISQTLVRELVLDSAPTATESVTLRAKPLHIVGAFRLIGALREVPAGPSSRKRHAIRVEFEPLSPLKYEDELELCALGVTIRVQLRGEGINPSLSLTPEDGELDFQDVLARTRNVRELVLTNGSAFPLAFSFVLLDGENVLTTSTGLPAFTFSPTSAIIPENGSVAVQVAFQPDHQRPGHYAQQYRIKVPNEREQHIVGLSGRCWENQLYVFVPSETRTENAAKKQPLLARRPVEDLFDLPPSISLNQLQLNVGANELPAAGLRKPSSTFTLTFAGGDAVPKTLFIGGTAPSSGSYGGFDEAVAAAAAGSAGSFEFTLDAASPHAKLFTLEPSRGAIASGQQLAVQVTYYPPAATVPGSDVSTSARAGAGTSERVRSAKRRPELEVVQWVQVRVQCTLKGGALWRTLPAIGALAVPAAAAATGGANQSKGANGGAAVADGVDTRTVTVLLRARLET